MPALSRDLGTDGRGRIRGIVGDDLAAARPPALLDTSGAPLDRLNIMVRRYVGNVSADSLSSVSHRDLLTWRTALPPPGSHSRPVAAH